MTERAALGGPLSHTLEAGSHRCHPSGYPQLAPPAGNCEDLDFEQLTFDTADDEETSRASCALVRPRFIICGALFVLTVPFVESFSK